MKKQVILGLVLSSAFASLAAGYKWQSISMGQGIVYDGSATTLYSTAPSTTLYLFMTDTLTQSQMFDALAKGTSASTLGSVASAPLTSASKITTTTFSQDAVKGTHDFYFVAQYTKEGTSQFYLSSLIEDAEYSSTATTSLQWADLNNSMTTLDAGKGFNGAGTYSVSAVPEPFSGALALLGMVGIGLRRKLKKQKKA